MANIKSQIKRNRQNEKRRLRNKAAKSEMKTRIKRAVHAADVDPTAEETVESLRVAVKRLDKGASHGIIHKNQAANRKSSLMRRVAALQAASTDDHAAS
ncbi:MAG: 30S ribosomal protein S20 [Actinomycetota bacterium]|nr:30S ribosomal protein S20 [Actinomycetota bacterium]MDQ6946853.1 30S ribosomal protein S20 [Actinomycetota bacterium]